MAEHFISAQRAEGNEHRTLNQPRENHGVQSAVVDCWGPPRNLAPSPITGASRENAGTTRPIGSGDSSLYEIGARAVDTKREAKEVQGEQRLELGIALAKGGDPFGQILNSIQDLPVEQQKQVVMTGASAFASTLADQTRQVMHGVHDGTGDFGVGAINTVGKVGNAAMGFARFEADLENNPVKAGGEILEIGMKIARTADGTGRAIHQGFEAATHYYRDAVTGKVQPLDDAQRIAIGGGKAAWAAYQRWDAQPTYDKTRQVTEGSWTFAVPNMLEGIAVLKTAGTPEAEAGLNAIQKRLENIDAIFNKYKEANDELHMPEVPEHLKHLEYQKASHELLQNIEAKGRQIVIAQPGTDDFRYLETEKLEANAGGSDWSHILLRPDAKKVAVLEEFLHGTQFKIGLHEHAPAEALEYRVKAFMIRHSKLLGLDRNDVSLLEALKNNEAEKTLKRGYPARLLGVGERVRKLREGEYE